MPKARRKPYVDISLLIASLIRDKRNLGYRLDIYSKIACQPHVNGIPKKENSRKIPVENSLLQKTYTLLKIPPINSILWKIPSVVAFLNFEVFEKFSFGQLIPENSSAEPIPGIPPLSLGKFPSERPLLKIPP